MENKKNHLEHFSKIEDPRVQGRVLHPSVNIIYITITASLCGVSGWEEIEDFAESRIEFFSKMLDLSNGIPSHDTINRFFQIIDKKMFARCFADWVSEIAKKIDNQTISIDGKTIRCSSKMSNEALPIHIISAWSNENQMTIGQVALEWQRDMDKQENEILAIPKLLDALDVEGSVITMDAIGTQAKIAEQIVKNKADYVLSVKENQKTLHDDIERYFSKQNNYEQKVEEDFGHGRIEKRTYQYSLDLSYLSTSEKWSNIQGIVKVNNLIINKKTGEQTSEDRYFITTLRDINQVAKSVRSHWVVEGMHWTLDVIFNEDNSTKREANAAYNYDIVRKMAMNMLKNDEYNHGKKKLSIRRKMLKAILDEKYLLHLLSKL